MSTPGSPNHNPCRRRPFAAMLFIALLSSMAAQAAVLANHNKRGLQVSTIEGVFRLQEDQIDLGTAALILSREWGMQRTTHVYRRTIDDMAEDILDTLKEKRIPVDYRAIPVINRYLFDELSFTSVETADDPEDLFLHGVLEKKRGYCLSLSVLYLAIAERLGLPMYGVVVPGHFFVRYDDGTRQYNIETTSQGGTAPDEHYIEEFKPPQNPRMLYMKNLTKKQTLGCFYNNLGNSYCEVGNLDKAFEVLLQAVRINPLLQEANMNLGNIYLRKKMPHQAIEQYEKALSIIVNDAKAMNNLGAAYMQLSDYPKAESYYRTALTLDPEFIDVYRNLAGAMQMQGKYDQAVSMLKAAVVLNPEDVESFLLLGDVCRSMEDFRGAEKYLLKALALDSTRIQAQVSLGYIYLDQNNLPMARSTFEAALRRDSALTQAWFGLARICNLYEQTDDEIGYYEKALSCDPYLVSALQNLGNAYAHQGSHSAAIETYRKAIHLEPENPDLHYNLAVAYAQLKQHQRAVTEFLKTVELDARNASAYHGLAISYYHLGQTRLAGSYARKAKALGFDVPCELLELEQ
jgi:tetratricopeptide (TPR) repeat protein